jgi:putative ABC transport system substrate-binding protein
VPNPASVNLRSVGEACGRPLVGLVDRLLKGANPANIPVEQANVFELVINLRTARALGIDLPRSVRLQAARVIE